MKTARNSNVEGVFRLSEAGIEHDILAEDHRSSIFILTSCIYWNFNIYPLFFIHISIHICWADKLSIDKSPVTDLIKKLFFRKTVHTVHCVFLFIEIIMLHGEWLVNSEHFTVHFCRFAGKKNRRLPVRVGYFVMGSSHFGSQSALLSSLSVRLVCMP